ncbi:MAG: PEP-CTERM sorting domain-containing protein [bacterium]|nr:PEP-CTERM sorting domain-containing protein [bacterium]
MRKCIGATCFILMMIGSVFGNAEADPATATFFIDGVALDTGAIYQDPTILIVAFGAEDEIIQILQPDLEQLADFDPQVDFHFDFTIAAENSALFVPEEGGDIVGMFASKKPLPDNIDVSMFEDPFSVSLEHDDILLLQTADKRYFELSDFSPQPMWALRMEIIDITETIVPEPSTIILLGLGLLSFLNIVRRRKNRNNAIKKITMLLVLSAVAAVLTLSAPQPAVAQISFDCTQIQGLPMTECEALVALYDSTDGAHWENNSGWFQNNTPCDGSWYGITCTPDSSHIQRIWLGQNNLSGPIPPEIGQLSELDELGLGVNHLTGQLPIQLTNLTKLQELYLFGNAIEGQLPSALGQLIHLRELNLGWNHLTGTIPETICNLSNLYNLSLNDNPLSGSLPECPACELSLQTLHFENTQICETEPVMACLDSGRIPDLGRSYLPCSPAPFTSCDDVRGIPKEECEALETLYNSTDGDNWDNNIGWLQIDSPCGWFGVSCVDGHVTQVALNENQLDGSIPADLEKLQHLEGLHLSMNHLSGEIPLQLGSLSFLHDLSLGGNDLKGEIPSQLGNLLNLHFLDLGWNALSGSIPETFCNLSKLEHLTFSDNQGMRGEQLISLAGPLPECIARDLPLQVLWFDDTLMCETDAVKTELDSGKIPDVRRTNYSCSAPILTGWKLFGERPMNNTPTIGRLPSPDIVWTNNLDLQAGIQVWTPVDGSNIHYYRRVREVDPFDSSPIGAWNELTNLIYSVPYMTGEYPFGPANAGKAYETQVRAFEDRNGNGTYEPGIDEAFDWSSSGFIGYQEVEVWNWDCDDGVEVEYPTASGRLTISEPENVVGVIASSWRSATLTASTGEEHEFDPVSGAVRFQAPIDWIQAVDEHGDPLQVFTTLFRRTESTHATIGIFPRIDFVYYYPYTPARTFTFPIPAALNSRSVEATFFVGDLDSDGRSFILGAQAGPVSVAQEYDNIPNVPGTKAGIFSLTLGDVPGDVTEVTATVKLPETHGDSLFLFNVYVKAGCEGSNIPTPELTGWKRVGETLDNTPTIACLTPPAVQQTNNTDRRAGIQVWNSVPGTHIRYVRQVREVDPETLTPREDWRVLSGLIYGVPYMTQAYPFTSADNGKVYETQVMAFEDNGNNQYDSDLDPASGWSNSCFIGYDETSQSETLFIDSEQRLGNLDGHGIALADLDGDGDLDAVVTNEDYEAISTNPYAIINGEVNTVWRNDGNGNFTLYQSFGNSDSLDVALGDVDGDGDIDAFVVNSTIHANKVWLNDGSGNFSDSGQALGNLHSGAVALGDVDGDNDLDAFVCNFSAPNKVWLNDGSGNFSDSGQLLGSSGSQDVELKDVDGDGDLDAFVANGWFDTGQGQPNTVWLNDGAGTFSDSGQSLGNLRSQGVALADLDGDGDYDAFVANHGEPNTVWFNDGNGNFSNSGQALGDSNSHAVALGDIDLDGDLDAVVANANDSSHQANTVWLNDGSGIFSDSGERLGNLESRGIGLGDLDGDDDLDAFVANWDNQSNTVWFNITDPAIQGVTLTVEHQGSGSGTVLIGDRICGSDCSIPFSELTALILKAIPEAGSHFVRWEDELGDTLSGIFYSDSDVTIVAVFEQN